MSIGTVLLYFRRVLIGFCVGITVTDTVGSVAFVDGCSMQPSLNPDLNTRDLVFLNRWALRTQNIQRGEIVSFIPPRKPGQVYIKRVIGLPGDVVVSKTDVLQVPEGHCWVEGDHTVNSKDSNSFGPVSIGLLTAKATCIIWPPSRWQLLNPSVPPHRLPLNLRNTSMS